MTVQSQPKVSGSGRITQLSYEVSHKINCAKVYPRKASNGSTIVIYGHGSGLRVVWIGGRVPEPSTALRDLSHASALNINDHKQQPRARASLTSTVQIHSHLDISLSSDVLQLSTPSISPRPLPGTFSATIFRSTIVVAAACADSTAKVIVLPLEPPMQDMKESSAPSIPDNHPHIATVAAGQSYRRSSTARVAITWTWSEQQEDADRTMNSEHLLEEDTRHRQLDGQCILLLASAVTDAPSTVFLTKIPMLETDGTFTIQSGHYEPFRKLRLASRLVELAFNPVLYPSARHTELLVAEGNGLVRIHDTLIDRSVSAERMNLAEWNCIFSTPYQVSRASTSAGNESPALARRKAILAARWACQGNAIIVLLSGGDYGFWDLDGSPSHFVNSFTLRGSLGLQASATQPNQVRATSRDNRTSRSSFAPMTPNTRAAKAEQLFSAAHHHTTVPNAPQGGLSVNSRGANVEDESVVSWYAGEIYSMLNLQAFRARQKEESTAVARGFSWVEGLNLHGQGLSCAEQLTPEHVESSHSQVDLVVATDHQLIILLKHVGASSSGRSPGFAGAEEDDTELAREEDHHTDMDLLDRSELGLPGIDKIADSMSGSRFGRNAGRKVLFAAS